MLLVRRKGAGAIMHRLCTGRHRHAQADAECWVLFTRRHFEQPSGRVGCQGCPGRLRHMPGQNLIAAEHWNAEFRFQWGDDVERAQIGAGQKDRFCLDRRGAGRSHDRSRRNPGYLRLLLLASLKSN